MSLALGFTAIRFARFLIDRKDKSTLFEACQLIYTVAESTSFLRKKNPCHFQAVVSLNWVEWGTGYGPCSPQSCCQDLKWQQLMGGTGFSANGFQKDLRLAPAIVKRCSSPNSVLPFLFLSLPKS